MSFHVPEKYRVRTGGGPYNSTEEHGNNGMFLVPVKGKKGCQRKRQVTIIASDGFGWEHVSVSLPDRPPTWSEMCQIKELFWDAEDLVVQFHPPRSQWVNNHDNCLHLWRPKNAEIPAPESVMVGVR